MNKIKYKKIAFLSCTALLLVACNENTSNSESSSRQESSIPPTSQHDEYLNQIYHKELVGYDQEGMDFEFFQEGFFGDQMDMQSNSIRLLRDDSFLLFPRFETNATEFKVELNMYLGGIDQMGSEFVGETFKIRVEAIDTNVSNDETFHSYDVVDSHTYSHVLTQEDLDNGYMPLFPKYSEDFSEDPFVCYLNGEGINRIGLIYELEPFVNNKGSNLYLHEIKISSK